MSISVWLQLLILGFFPGATFLITKIVVFAKVPEATFIPDSRVCVI